MFTMGRMAFGTIVCYILLVYLHQVHCEALPSLQFKYDFPGFRMISSMDENLLRGRLVHSGDIEWMEQQTDTENRHLFESKFAKLELTPLSILQTNCYTMTLTPVPLNSISCNFVPEVCFELADAFWYGGAELNIQRWPLNDVTLPMQPFVTNDLVPLNASFGNVIERYWINSKGIGIYVDKSSPLHVSFNENKHNEMCFRSQFSDIFKRSNQQFDQPELKFTVCKGRNIKETHLSFTKTFFDQPDGMPDERMFRAPIWSTWAKYKVDIDQQKVLEYADEIVQHGFTNSQIEIDDMFTTFYGEFDFCPKKFKNPTEMIKTLKRKGFRVTVWITPFANLESSAFKTGMDHSYWLKDIKGEVPALVKWWQGIGGTLDVTNPEAVRWYLRRLTEMKERYGVDSFKFDAGEVTYLPSSCRAAREWADPCTYTSEYVKAVSTMGPMIEVRCCYRSQRFPVFVRMGDKESRWGYNNGLKTLIPTILTMGILGYPYVLPDMIGGNGYNYDTEIDNPFIQTLLPDRELYIRWLQVTAYMPAMQFSFVPWQYDDEVVRIAKKFVNIHEEVVTPIILEAAQMAQIDGSPLIRPLWWIAPEDLNALECDSEFLVGDRLLVAPVLEQGARSRDIYLPEGRWEDTQNGETVTGGAWLYRYRAELDEVPVFRLLD